MRDIYEDLYHIRNDRNHSVDLYNSDLKQLSKKVMDILALYVYTYRIIERNQVSEAYKSWKYRSERYQY